MEYIGKLIVVGLIPVVVSGALIAITDFTNYGKIKDWIRQIIAGVVFGIIAIIGTEKGIPIEGAVINARDAAPLCAGLIFGPWSGIIAGVMGGVERWFAVLWGAGQFTRLACSISTAVAGVFAALISKYMFDKEVPNPSQGLLFGTAVEVFHMMMVYFTNVSEPIKAFEVVETCTIPMVSVNALSVTAALLVVGIIGGNIRVKRISTIAEKILNRLLIAILIGLVGSLIFTASFQSEISDRQVDTELTTALKDLQKDISEAADNSLLKLAHEANLNIRPTVGTSGLITLASVYDFAEINVVNKDGIIERSNIPDYIGFDMSSGKQSSEFLRLINSRTKEYVQEFQPIAYDSDTYRKYVAIATDEGFVQFGFDETKYHEILSENIRTISTNRHIGERGYMAIQDRKGQFVKLLSEEISANAEYSKFIAPINSVDSYCMYTMAEGYYIFAIVPCSQINMTRDTELYLITFIDILLFSLLYVIIYLIIKRLVVNGVRKITKSLAKITEGDLDELVNVRSSAEFDSLSNGINATVDELKEKIAEAKHRIDEELKFCTSIQQSVLPSEFPPFPERTDIDLFASMDPAKEVGGDFYDYYWIGPDRLAVLIADVSGKGIPGAMFMMRAKTMIKAFVEDGLDVHDALTSANEGLCEGNEAEMFVTAWLGFVDVKTGHIEYANAGHNAPVIKHKDGRFEYLVSRPGFVLAGMEGMKYRKQILDLEPGAILYLYTDGVTEAQTTERELFGEERLLDCLNNGPVNSMRKLCENVTACKDEFVGEAEQFDDITMVALKLAPEEVDSMDDQNKELTMEATIENIPAVTEWVNAKLEENNCNPKAQMQIDIAIDELFSNIAKFAYNPEIGNATVKVEVGGDPLAVTITFVDKGVPYDPLARQDPDTKLPVEERDIGGLGIFMVKKTMDDVRYEYKDGQNILTIIKKI